MRHATGKLIDEGVFEVPDGAVALIPSGVGVGRGPFMSYELWSAEDVAEFMADDHAKATGAA